MQHSRQISNGWMSRNSDCKCGLLLLSFPDLQDLRRAAKIPLQGVQIRLPMLLAVHMIEYQRPHRKCTLCIQLNWAIEQTSQPWCFVNLNNTVAQNTESLRRKALHGTIIEHQLPSCQSKYTTRPSEWSSDVATVKGDIEDQSALHVLAGWLSKISKKVTRLLGGGPAWHHAASCQSKYSTDFNDTTYIV